LLTVTFGQPRKLELRSPCEGSWGIHTLGIHGRHNRFDVLLTLLSLMSRNSLGDYVARSLLNVTPQLLPFEVYQQRTAAAGSSSSHILIICSLSRMAERL
jgi:hypothetical protein